MYNEENASSPFSQQESSFDEPSSNDEMEWEQVDVPQENPPHWQNENATTDISTSRDIGEGPSKPLEITLDNEEDIPKVTKKRVMSHAERVLRLQVHKIHTICLIANGSIRNKYLNDSLLHARLISLTPLQLQLAFSNIHKKREPDVRRRGRMFEAAMVRLVQWWRESFFRADPRNSGEIQNQTFDEVQRKINSGSKGFKEQEEESNDESEIIRSCKSLQKLALLREGSQDVSAQLFTALCRGLDIPARLIVSVQSVPWKASVGRDPGQAKKSAESENPEPPKDRKGKGKAIFPGNVQKLNGSTPEPQDKTPPIKLRSRRSQGKSVQSKQVHFPPPLGYPPTQWTEVFSRADGRWIPVDPIRGFVDKKGLFEPPPHDKRNRMVYVLAFEEDGFVRDVTQRYAREFNKKTSKFRLGGRGKKEWWDTVMSFISRPYRLHRDDLEDAELESQQIIEGMPTSVAAFKDHPIYVLERHVLRDQVIHPRTEIGRFRGEPVFSRANLITGLKTSENWMRSGRVVKEGEQPLKSAKVRPVTINRKRALELAENEASTSISGDTADGATQGLYAEDQTELYVPPPVVNGKVPKNDFGNIDLYVDTMLPAGAVHVPFKGAAKVAKMLGFDYAEAVTGFEFKNRRAFPILTGIVLATENESAFLEGYWEVAKDTEAKERLKKEKQLLKQWARIINGLRVRKRLQEQYADDGNKHAHGIDNREDIEPEPGGFLVNTADAVVQSFSLPKPSHAIASTSNDNALNDEEVTEVQHPAKLLPDLILGEDNTTGEVVLPTETEVDSMPQRTTALPKTLQEIAETNPDAFRPIEEEPVKSATQTKTPAKPPKGTNSSRKARQTPKAVKSTRRQKRPRSESSDPEGEQSSGEDSDATPSRRRKVRVVASAPSERVLRPRKPKNEEVLRQERERELAIKRALADS